MAQDDSGTAVSRLQGLSIACIEILVPFLGCFAAFNCGNCVFLRFVSSTQHIYCEVSPNMDSYDTWSEALLLA